MTRLAGVLCVVLMSGSVLAEDLFGDPAKVPSKATAKAAAADKGARAVTLAEAEKLKKLREIAKSGDNKKIIEWTGAVDLKDATFDFRKEVLTLRAEAIRRSGQPLGALATLRTLMRYAAKLPDFRRKKEVQPLVLPMQVLGLSKRGYYRSPSKPAKPGEKGIPIDDDANWASAKSDYGRYLLGRLDAKVKKVARMTSPATLQAKMLEALRVTDVVRPHNAAAAKGKANEVASAFAERIGVVLDSHRVMPLAASLCDGSLLPKGKAISQKVRLRTCNIVLAELRAVYIANYNAGQALTGYARGQGILSDLGGPLGRLKSKNDSLRRLWVETDNWAHFNVYHAYATVKHTKNYPLKKIPTKPW